MANGGKAARGLIWIDVNGNEPGGEAAGRGRSSGQKTAAQRCFRKSQGTWLDGYAFNKVNAMNADGTKLIGTANGPFGTAGYIVELDKVNICHVPPGNPTNTKTVNVPFRVGMGDHLSHGDTIGVCSETE